MSEGRPMTLHDLLARVESATGMDREIDAQVHEALIGPVEVDDDGDRFLLAPRGGFAPLEFYTASVDATIALQERVLPGWTANLSIGGGEKSALLWWQERAVIKSTDEVECATPALAHLSAIIRALIAKGESDE